MESSKCIYVRVCVCVYAVCAVCEVYACVHV